MRQQFYYSAVYLPLWNAANDDQSPLSKGVKKLINAICDDVIEEWPPFSDTSTAESKNVMIFVTPYAFYELVFKDLLQLRVNRSIVERSQVSNK